MKNLVDPTLYALTKPYIFCTKKNNPDRKQGKMKKIENPVRRVKKSPESTAIVDKLLLGLIVSSKKFNTKQKLTQQNIPNFSARTKSTPVELFHISLFTK